MAERWVGGILKRPKMIGWRIGGYIQLVSDGFPRSRNFYYENKEFMMLWNKSRAQYLEILEVTDGRD